MMGTNTYAAGVNWVVSKVAGQAILTKINQEPQWVMLNDSVGAGDKIVTLANGTVALTRNSEAMIISASSEMQIPFEGNDAQVTTIFQTLGTILFSAKRKKTKHFLVKTPYSAAIVKGTTFAVNVNRYNAQIQVFEGRVSVKGRDRSEVYAVGAGQKSLVPRDLGQKILINRVRNASPIHPHFGNDIENLSRNYIDKIEIGTVNRNQFTHNIVTRIGVDGLSAVKPSHKDRLTNRPVPKIRNVLKNGEEVRIVKNTVAEKRNDSEKSRGNSSVAKSRKEKTVKVVSSSVSNAVSSVAKTEVRSSAVSASASSASNSSDNSSSVNASSGNASSNASDKANDNGNNRDKTKNGNNGKAAAATAFTDK